MVIFEKKLVPNRFEGLPMFLPGWVTSESTKNKDVFWTDSFTDETDKYFLMGSGSYYHLSGIVPEIYESYFEKSPNFAHYVLESVVLFHDNRRNFIGGSVFGNYGKKDFLNGKNSPLDFLFKKEDGKIAQTDNEKNILIEGFLKDILRK